MVNKRNSPGVGHNSASEPPDQKDMLRALAVYILDEEEAARLREKRKVHSKAAQGKRITAEDVKEMFKFKDSTGSELEAVLNRIMLRMGAVNPDLGKQLNMFKPTSTTTQKAAYRQTGMMAGISGQKFTPPPGIAGDSLQEMLEGHNLGSEMRAAAEQERLEEMRKALAKAENDEKARLAEQSKTAAAINDQAAADFAKDNGRDPLMFRGEKYKSVRAATEARKQWILAHPGEDPEPAPAAPEPVADGEVNAGAAPVDTIYTLSSDEPFESGRLKTYRNGEGYDTGAEGEFPVYDAHPLPEEAPAPSAPVEFDEASPEELAKQTGRQQAEPLDEDAIAAGVKKLAADPTFAPPPKKPRGGKAAGKLN